MILARITSQYDDVYFLAIDSSVCRSSLERFMLKGLFLGIRHYSSDASLSDHVTNSTQKYVIVFPNSCTKLETGTRRRPPQLMLLRPEAVARSICVLTNPAGQKMQEVKILSDENERRPQIFTADFRSPKASQNNKQLQFRDSQKTVRGNGRFRRAVFIPRF